MGGSSVAPGDLRGAGEDLARVIDHKEITVGHPRRGRIPADEDVDPVVIVHDPLPLLLVRGGARPVGARPRPRARGPPPLLFPRPPSPAQRALRARGLGPPPNENPETKAPPRPASRTSRRAGRRPSQR